MNSASIASMYWVAWSTGNQAGFSIQVPFENIVSDTRVNKNKLYVSMILVGRNAYLSIIIMKDANLCAGGYFDITHNIYAIL